MPRAIGVAHRPRATGAQCAVSLVGCRSLDFCAVNGLSFQCMLELEEARQRIFDSLTARSPEGVPVSDASGRILSEAPSAPRDLPPFDSSAMDGFAVQA